MIKRLIPSFAAVAILVLGACSTNKLAQQKDQVDDAYYTEAQAREYEVYAAKAVESKSDYVTDDELYGDYDNSYDDRDDYYDRNYSDRDYSARIYRFRNYSPWRSYYDSYYGYGYDPYYSNFNSYNYYNGPGFGINIGFGRPYGYNYGYNNYNPWNYYGSQYYGNYWGPYSYYNTYNPYYYGGRYGNNYGGYYGNVGRTVVPNPNYRTRPNRETENIRTGVNGSDGRIGTTPSRPERISTRPAESGETTRSVGERTQPVRTSRPSRSNDGNTTRERTGTRPSSTESSRPQRESSPPPRTESRPAERQSSPPPSSTPSRSNDNNNSNSRPSRTGGR